MAPQSVADQGATLAEIQIAAHSLSNDGRIFELTAWITRRQGKTEDGLHSLARVLQLEPRNLVPVQQVGLMYQMLRRFPEAWSCGICGGNQSRSS